MGRQRAYTDAEREQRRRAYNRSPKGRAAHKRWLKGGSLGARKARARTYASTVAKDVERLERQKFRKQYVEDLLATFEAYRLGWLDATVALKPTRSVPKEIA